MSLFTPCTNVIDVNCPSEIRDFFASVNFTNELIPQIGPEFMRIIFQRILISFWGQKGHFVVMHPLAL